MVYGKEDKEEGGEEKIWYETATKAEKSVPREPGTPPCPVTRPMEACASPRQDFASQPVRPTE
jgi:hypothetical protein